MAIVPAFTKVVVQAPREPESGIKDFDLAPGSKERPVVADVVAVGAAVTFCKPGDRVCYTKYAPNEIELDDQTFYVLSEEDLLAKIEE